MPSGRPKRPPLAMKLWLARRFGLANVTTPAAKPGHTAGKTMSIESLEHIVRSRVRMFLRHTWLVTILGSIIIGGGVWAAFYFMTEAIVLRVAAGPPGSAGVKLVQVLAQKFAGDRDRIRLRLVSTDGAKESAEAIAAGTADLAVLPSTLGNSPAWPVVAIVRQNVMALIVPAAETTAKKEAGAPAKKEASPPKKEKSAKTDRGTGGAKAAKGAKTAANVKAAKTDKSAKAAKDEDTDSADDKSTDDKGGDSTATSDDNKLDKVAKLAGHRVGIVTGGAATPELFDVVLAHYGVPSGQVQVSLIDPQNAADAVKAKRIDALFVAGTVAGKSLTDAVAAATLNGVAPSFIDIDQAEGIAKRSPAFDSIDVEAGTFGGQPPSPDDSLKTLGFPEYLVARKNLNRDGIATLAKLIFTSRVALAAELPGEIKITAPSTDKDAAILVHPGALAYLTDDQKSFFDKYGDDIFYGLLIFPIFGSAIAGVASYFRNTGRTRRLRLLQRLLDLVRKAHAAASLEALDHLETNLDHLVIAIIHQSEHEEYDQTVQTSFSLALDQARFAIASRRAVLRERGGADAKAGFRAA